MHLTNSTEFSKATGALMALLRDAMHPNLVQALSAIAEELNIDGLS